MNLPLLAPMPHEFVLAHAGRIGFFFCGRIAKSQRLRLIERLAEKHCEGTAAFSLLEQVATIAGMNASDYARQHSLLPALRVAERDTAPALHGSAVRQGITKLVGSRLHTHRVHLCPRCVAEDLSHWGFSWFRRTHNLAGVEACPVHGEALHWVKNPDPFSLLPQHWVELGEVERVEFDLANEAERQFQIRLQEIYEMFLDRDRPFDLSAIYGPLARRVREIGLRNSRTGVKPPLSDYVLNSAPRAWLVRHWPELCKKESGEFFSSLDRLPGPYVTPGSGCAYAVALVTLFESTEEAARSLATPVARRKPDEKAAMKSQYSAEYWTTEFLEVFISCAGNITAISKQLGLDRGYVARKTKSLGLPSLKGISSTPRWRALERFGAGEGLAAACSAEGVDLGLVEELLRVASGKLFRAVKSVKSKKSSEVTARGVAILTT
ncbi:TniQ family protein [Acidovorax kalamii]|uniref:TniQ domain-containing protein n=1 Tax=Acidovorax kalamii TaxID=2004485 RepID=A0A235EGD1_9BURK|nr:TniQ family protein [Acidovorax kalamii]OYD48092.1 hypothetical protein CBY09_21335 [Acidovorax kalamii]